MRIQTPRESYDVLVIGAGMVGASFALALSRAVSMQPCSVLVVESGRINESDSDSPSFDDRSTALSFGSAGIMQELSLWPELRDLATPIETIHVSDRGRFGSTMLRHDEQGVEALGYVVENRVLGHALNRALLSAAELELLSPARIDSVRPVRDGMAVELVDAREVVHAVRASLVVLADGGRSPICGQLGITVDCERYGQHAIISNIAFEKPHRNVAYERFTDSGPLAVLPLPDLAGEHRGALVWTVVDSDAKALVEMPESEALCRLQDRFGYRLGRILRIGSRAAYPLNLQLAREQVRPGLVLLGNVAHTLHPVAGQGFNLALRDAYCLAETLAVASEAGQGQGEMRTLQDFLDRRTGDQQRTIGFSHYLTRLFASDRGSLVWARKFGLASIDLLPVVRRGFARAAMGLSDR